MKRVRNIKKEREKGSDVINPLRSWYWVDRESHRFLLSFCSSRYVRHAYVYVIYGPIKGKVPSWKHYMQRYAISLFNLIVLEAVHALRS